MAEHMINNASPSAQGRGGVVVPSICVFDVNETLLDIEFIAPLFERLFATAGSCVSGLDSSSSTRRQ